MKYGMDDRLKEKMDQDLMAMAEKREKLLKESVKSEGPSMSADRLEAIHQEIAARSRAVRKKRLHRRTFVAVALVAVLCIGMGVASSGKKVYIPELFHRERGDEVTTKINNSDAIASQEDEEEICQEIEDKMGVLPVRFGYRPEKMALIKYTINDGENEAVLRYGLGEGELHVYISKDYEDATINYQVDGVRLDTAFLMSCGFEVEIFQYEDPYGNTYFVTSFEFLNTYYLVNGMMEQEEFEKIIEN
ncbi:MAG TPA: hypothetical protein DD414_02125, partial [Lachnospiraceae bacterium]|nr:hypothetical protein [Lachnospiraceae bacterium]